MKKFLEKRTDYILFAITVFGFYLAIGAGIDGINNRIDGINTRIDGINTRIDSINRHFLVFENRLATLEEKHNKNIENIIKNALEKHSTHKTIDK